MGALFAHSVQQTQPLIPFRAVLKDVWDQWKGVFALLRDLPWNMDALVHSRGQRTVESEDFTLQTCLGEFEGCPIAGRVTSTVFLDLQGERYILYLRKGKKVTGQYYAKLWAESTLSCRTMNPFGEERCSPSMTTHKCTPCPPPWPNWSSWSTNCSIIPHTRQIWHHSILPFSDLKKSLARHKF